MPDITPGRWAALLAHCTKLLDLAERWLDSGVRAKDEDHLAFMAVTFAAKQRLHFESMGVLASGGCYADLATIARVMLDGLTVLKWSAHRPDERPLAWRAYALVSDHKLLEAKRAKGEPVDEQHEQELLQQLQDHGQRFLSKAPPKPGSSKYRRRWSLDDDGKQVTIEQMMKEIGADPLYELYDQWSGWMHWSAPGLGYGIHREDAQVRYRWNTEVSAAAALAVGFQALVETLQFLDDHIALGRRVELDEVVASYLRDLGSSDEAT